MKRATIGVAAIAIAIGLLAGPLPGTLAAAIATVVMRAAAVCTISVGAVVGVLTVREVLR